MYLGEKWKAVFPHIFAKNVSLWFVTHTTFLSKISKALLKLGCSWFDASFFPNHASGCSNKDLRSFCQYTLPESNLWVVGVSSVKRERSVCIYVVCLGWGLTPGPGCALGKSVRESSPWLSLSGAPHSCLFSSLRNASDSTKSLSVTLFLKLGS